MIERRETERRHGFSGSDRIEINADKLERITRYPDREGELRVLKAYNFIDLDESERLEESNYWRISFPGTPGDFELMFLDYSEKNGIPLIRSLVSLDFSGF
jgi:hypothetical protein